MTQPRVIVALDVSDAAAAVALSPRRAIEAGATYLVVGQPVTRAADPRAVLERIHEEILGAERTS